MSTEAFLPERSVLEFFITLLWYLPGWISEAGSKHENTGNTDRDVMKANDIPFFRHPAAFTAKCWKMLTTGWEKRLLQKNIEQLTFPQSGLVW